MANFLTYICLSILAWSTVNCHDWSYLENSQKRWSEIDSACDGRHQSPINIVTYKTVKREDLTIELTNYDQILDAERTKISNTGHSVQLIPKPDLPITINGTTFKNEIYQLIQFHLHWHDEDDKGTEHAVNDEHFAAEMHFVHQNVKYKSVAEASKHSDGFAVFGVIYEVKSRDNPKLAPLISEIINVQLVSIKDRLVHNISLMDLMPNNVKAYYTYNGSFTTPPCHESVTWVVFKERLPIGKHQLREIRKLHEGNSTQSKLITNNVRLIQEVNDRIVFATDAAFILMFSQIKALIIASFLLIFHLVIR